MKKENFHISLIFSPLYLSLRPLSITLVLLSLFVVLLKNTNTNLTSFPSAGLKTNIFGIALICSNISIGWWVGPEKEKKKLEKKKMKRRMEKCVK